MVSIKGTEAPFYTSFVPYCALSMEDDKPGFDFSLGGSLWLVPKGVFIMCNKMSCGMRYIDKDKVQSV